MAKADGQQNGTKRSLPDYGLPRVPGPRRRTSIKRVFFSLLLTILVLVTVAGGVALWAVKEVQAPGPLEAPKAVVIERGQGTAKIGEALEKHGVVSDQKLFTAAAYLTRPRAGDLRAGEYEFPPGASVMEVLAIIRTGRSVVHKLTVPEGFTTAQVVERVLQHPALSGNITEIPPEGTLLPDTYVFQRGLDRQALLNQMRDAQQKLVDSLWEERAPNLPLANKQQAVILASIVEKETGVPEERRQVAAVFVNRLRKNMRLQSDPTIIYGIVGGRGRLDRPILQSDIETNTEYNTYRIDGLPPTPIANPGRESLLAVLRPAPTEDLYFVADGTGGHAFARTLPEHRQNVRKWRKIEIEMTAEDEEASGAAAELATAKSMDTGTQSQGQVATARNEEPPATVSERPIAAPAEEPDSAEAKEPASSEPEAPAPVVPDSNEPADAPAPPSSGAEASEPHSATGAETKNQSGNDSGAITAPKPGSDVAQPQPSPSPAAPVTAAPKPKSKPDITVQIARRVVPIPRPKPKRN